MGVEQFKIRLDSFVNHIGREPCTSSVVSFVLPYLCFNCCFFFVSGHFWTCVRIVSIPTSQYLKRVKKLMQSPGRLIRIWADVFLLYWLVIQNFKITKMRGFSRMENDVLTKWVLQSSEIAEQDWIWAILQKSSRVNSIWHDSTQGSTSYLTSSLVHCCYLQFALVNEPLWFCSSRSRSDFRGHVTDSKRQLEPSVSSFWFIGLGGNWIIGY